jgi:signal transduction histidine kinase
VILANQRINTLCFQIAGRDLQNAQIFWDLLRSGDPIPGVHRIASGNQPVFQLTEGSVWTFSCKEVEDIFQLSAAQTTEIHTVTEELKQKNIELEALNLRLRKYGENVDELTRAKERLETKSRIHSELGQALLASRRYLVNEGDCKNIPLEQWRSSIALLRKEAEQRDEEKPLEMLQRIAASTGIATKITGALPVAEDIQKLFVEAAAEALTNAISHAQAKTLYIDLKETAKAFSASFRNDGIPPQGVITEGGGLGSLRKKLEREGGTMTVSSCPDFALTVVLPKKGEIRNDSRIACGR